MKNTQKTDNRTVQQVAKAIAAMRRRVAAAVRRHEKLQVRIKKLAAAGRIVSLNRDSDILAGIEGWYVKAESLNPDPDSMANWYYETTWNAEAGYGCSCESLKPCKHITKLAATFAPVQPSEAERVEAEAVKERLEAELVLFQAEQYTKELVEYMSKCDIKQTVARRQVEAWTDEEEQRYNAPLTSNQGQGFSLLRRSA